jgi:hypothetical protein
MGISKSGMMKHADHLYYSTTLILHKLPESISFVKLIVFKYTIDHLTPKGTKTTT